MARIEAIVPLDTQHAADHTAEHAAAAPAVMVLEGRVARLINEIGGLARLHADLLGLWDRYVVRDLARPGADGLQMMAHAAKVAGLREADLRRLQEVMDAPYGAELVRSVAQFSDLQRCVQAARDYLDAGGC